MTERKMKTVLLWLGILILGISPVDLYVAPQGMPNAFLSVYVLVDAWPINSFEEALFSIGSAMYPILVCVAISYHFMQNKYRFLITFIPVAAIASCFTFSYVCLTSGYDNINSIIASIVSVVLVVLWAILTHKDNSANKEMHPASE